MLKIRLVEDVLDDVKQRNKERNDILNQLRDLFTQNDFTESVEINGISFNNETESISSSFYVNDDLTYRGYITKSGNNSSNYSLKGDMNNIIKAANDLIANFLREQGEM